MEGGEFGPLGAGIFFHDQLHPLVVDLAAHVGVALAGRGTREYIRAFDLPADVGGAVESLGRQWRGWKQIVNAVVEAQGVLGGVATSAAAAGFIFGVGSLAKNNLVAVGSGQVDQGLAAYPSSDGLVFGFG